MALQAPLHEEDTRRASLTASLVLRGKGRKPGYTLARPAPKRSAPATEGSAPNPASNPNHNPNPNTGPESGNGWLKLCESDPLPAAKHAAEPDQASADPGSGRRVAKTVRVSQAMNKKIWAKCKKRGLTQQAVMLDLLETWLSS